MFIIKKYFILVFAIALLAAAGMLVAPLHKDQIRYDLTSDPVKGMGPDIVLLTTALGAFRGLVINVIWIRMERLKQDGKFFEIAQLADLACRLAPRFPKVWDFNAWNMAYNISVQIPDYNERWPWVRRGIELLRDQGIPNNPEEPELYFSLAWIYMHKIGDQLDDAHFWYKQRLGLKMHELLGGRGSPEVLEKMAETPVRKETLLQDEEVRDFHNRLTEEGFNPLRKGEEGEMQFFSYLRNPDAIPENARALMDAERFRDQREEIATFARAHKLREEKRLIPDIMLDLMDEYGPLDWRNPFSHAIYWATLGRRAAVAYRDRAFRRRMLAEGMSPEEIMQTPVHEWEELDEWVSYRYRDIDYDRIVYNSLQNIVTQGRLLFDSQGRLMPMMGPDYRFSEPMVEQFELMLDKYEVTDRYTTGIRSAYENFLRNAAVEFFYKGSTSDSRRYFEKLRERFPKDQYDVPHERFVTEELREYVSIAGPAQIRRLIRGLLYQSYLNLGAGADDRAEALHGRARRMAALWEESAVSDVEPGERMAADFDSIRESALIDIFSGAAGFPGEFVDVLRESLPSDVVRRVEEAAKEAEEERDPLPFDIEDRMETAPEQLR